MTGTWAELGSENSVYKTDLVEEILTWTKQVRGGPGDVLYQRAKRSRKDGNHGMRIELKHSYLSIQEMNGFDLPDFAVLIGRNGIGKTQLLDAVTSGAASVSELPKSSIEKYDINSFQPKNSEAANWGNSRFAENTAEQYFSSPKSGPALVEIAKEIFQKFGDGSGDRTDDRRAFEDALQEEIRRIPDFSYFPNIKASPALAAYSQAILENVIGPLRSRNANNRTSRSNEKGSCANDSALLVSLAMKLTGKLPHELCRDDILGAAHYEGDTIANTLSQTFTRYKVEQHAWAHTQGEAGQGTIQELKSAYRQQNRPPWELLRESLDRMREASDDPQLFNFDFSDPENDTILYTNQSEYSFQAQFSNRTTGARYSVGSLSSGEKIMMSLCLAAFNRTMGRSQPGLLLFDELDAVLHPSMIAALIAGLKDPFVANGTRVIMATHSVTTVSLLEEGEIFRVARNGYKVDVRPVGKREAVFELSEGLATIDTGLRIAAAGGAAPVTILTEGLNTLHLKKWAELYFPGKVHIFDELPARTGKDQLLTYGQLLAKMEANSHFLIVWDCDAESTAKKLSKELSESAKVTAFSFRKRENRITAKGIENKYDEKFLKPYSKISLDGGTGKETGRSFNCAKKTEFANHVSSHGTVKYFEHFDDLRAVVEAILRRTEGR